MRDLRAVTLPQPHASLVAAGVQTIVTLPRPTDWRGDLLIHADGEIPSGWANGLGPEVGDWTPVEHWGGVGWWMAEHANRGYEGAPDDIPLPLGAVVAVARVTDCVPIVASGNVPPFDPTTGTGRCVVLGDDELWGWHLLNSNEVGWVDISDQLPYADFTPGRWALLLDDVRPVHVPDVKGRPGVWTPDPDLTRRVEDADG